MATQNSTSTLKRADHPVRRTGTPNWHYASMRCAEQSARSISVRLSVRRSLGAISADEFAEMRAAQDSFYLLAAAHRNSAHRLERGERLRIRLERALRPVTRIVRSVRRAVTA